VRDTLAAMAAAFGEEREVFLAREITKTFETLRRDTLGGLLSFVEADHNQQKGEIVLVVAACQQSEGSLDLEIASLLLRLAQELPAKKAAAIVAEHAGLRKKDLYNYLLEQKSG
jgi:16S rRNA (cytidine1402-2'-O)-methyltransferase